jgi:ParB/RepB/Spo0J family partition protein
MAKRVPEDLGELGGDRMPTAAKGNDDVSERERSARKAAPLRQVSCFKLKAHSLQPSDRHSDINVADLMESILSLGLQEPPLVRLLSNGEYVILAGHRRVRAWQRLALDGHVGERMRIFLLSDIDDREAVYIIAAEYAHRREYDLVHTARIIGRACEERGRELGREPSAADVADVVPWGRSSVAAYRKVYETLQDPRLAPLVQRLDRPDISLLYNVLGVGEFSRKIELLNAFHESGATGVRKALRASKGGRPLKPATKEQRRDREGYELTVRVRPTMTIPEIEAAIKSTEDALADLHDMLVEKSAQRSDEA